MKMIKLSNLIQSDASKQYFNGVRANVRSYSSKSLDVLKKVRHF